MATLADRIFDNGLSALQSEANRIDACTSEPTTYAEATSTLTLANKAGITVTGPTDRSGGGREVTIGLISDGAITGTGTATCFAITDTVNERLLATQALSSSLAVVSGDTFIMTEIKIGIPDPT